MGFFKDGVKKNEVEDYLVSLEFKKTSGATGEKGFTRVFNSREYYLWVTFDLRETKKVYFYEEYSCGGKSDEFDMVIPDNVIKDKESFITWVDDNVSHIIDNFIAD